MWPPAKLQACKWRQRNCSDAVTRVWPGVFAKLLLLLCHCKCTEIARTPNPPVWAQRTHWPQSPQNCSKIQSPVEAPQCPTTPLNALFCILGPKCSSPHKACTAHVCKPLKMLWFYPQVRGAAGRHCGFLPFFSLPLFFPLFAAPSLTWRVKSMASSFLGQLCQIIWCELMSTRA